jgi:hypothetical protein
MLAMYNMTMKKQRNVATNKTPWLAALVLAATMLPAHAAETGERTYGDPACSDRNADPEKCVLQVGPPPQARAAAAPVTQEPPVSNPVPPVSAGGVEKPPLLAPGRPRPDGGAAPATLAPTPPVAAHPQKK